VDSHLRPWPKEKKAKSGRFSTWAGSAEAKYEEKEGERFSALRIAQPGSQIKVKFPNNGQHGKNLPMEVTEEMGKQKKMRLPPKFETGGERAGPGRL